MGSFDVPDYFLMENQLKKGICESCHCYSGQTQQVTLPDGPGATRTALMPVCRSTVRPITWSCVKGIAKLKSQSAMLRAGMKTGKGNEEPDSDKPKRKPLKRKSMTGTTEEQLAFSFAYLMEGFDI